MDPQIYLVLDVDNCLFDASLNILTEIKRVNIEYIRQKASGLGCDAMEIREEYVKQYNLPITGLLRDERIKPRVTHEEYVEYLDGALDYSPIKPNSKLGDLLKKAHENAVKLVIFSNGNLLHVERCLNNIGISMSLFHEIFVTEDFANIGTQKPNSEAYLRVQQVLGRRSMTSSMTSLSSTADTLEPLQSVLGKRSLTSLSSAISSTADTLESLESVFTSSTMHPSSEEAITETSSSVISSESLSVISSESLSAITTTASVTGPPSIPVSADCIYFVDDSLDNCIGAKKCGWHVVQVSENKDPTVNFTYDGKIPVISNIIEIDMVEEFAHIFRNAKN